MGRQKPVSTLVAVAAAISLLAGAGAASAKTGDLAPHAFRPRIGFAMGILPKLGTQPEITSGTNWPVVYHGGDVMRNVTLHTIFWAPPGYHFDGSPSPGTLGYEAADQAVPVRRRARLGSAGQRLFDADPVPRRQRSREHEYQLQPRG